MNRYTLFILLKTVLFFFISKDGKAQSAFHQLTIDSSAKSVVTITPSFFGNKKNADLFGKAGCYIKNLGQYGNVIEEHPEMGKILYGYEGFDMPVLFTEKGMIFLQRKMSSFSENELEEMEKEGKLEEEMKKETFYDDGMITSTWVNANPHPEVIVMQPLKNYFTYGKQAQTVQAFDKIIYKELYPGIDVVLSFVKNNTNGFEYSMVVRPGADLNAIKISFGGDIKHIQEDEQGELIIGNDIGSIVQGAPVSYYSNDPNYSSSPAGSEEKRIYSQFKVKNSEVSFQLPQEYDKTQTLIIDPFVSSTNNFTGTNSGIAKDIDYDYEGNIYVSGGGSSAVHELAKFDKTGSLLWTFDGAIGSPFWRFGNNYGGWVVERNTGEVYLGQGGTAGFQIIRLDKSGSYDGYISTQNMNFQENWKMLWNCGGASPEIMVAGGGTTDNINLGICSPPITDLSSLNITGQTGGHQDLSDMVIDPKTNDLYSIFSQAFVPLITENNRIYKHKAPYGSSNTLWNKLSGYDVLHERQNRPYLADAPSFNDNSINSLAVNSSNLFYYDGLNLKAFNKSTGADVGSITLAGNTLLMEGGIIADECNNVYVGSSNGTIKVYKFNGVSFNDGAAPDISISGFPTSFVYDLAFDNGKNLLYACGKGFVAAVDISSYCATPIYSLSIKTDCLNESAIASISPSVPAGASLTYVLYNGNTQVNSNTTGVFGGLDPTAVYTLKALVNKACGGTQAIKNFTLAACAGGTGGATGIFVPSGFTPNGDGQNDVLRAVARGIKEFRYFNLYNRWGELVFSTKDPTQGWDGKLKGVLQGTGVFVWIAEAVDYNDKVIKLKGTTALIR